MEPNTVPAENWTDLIGAVIIGPIVHGVITLLSKFWIFQDENLAKGTGVLLCFVFMWLFSLWFDPGMTPKVLVVAGLAAWGAASSAKLGQNVATKVLTKEPTNP